MLTLPFHTKRREARPCPKRLKPAHLRMGILLSPERETESCSRENGNPAVFSTHVSQQTCAVLISSLAHCSAQGQH